MIALRHDSEVIERDERELGLGMRVVGLSVKTLLHAETLSRARVDKSPGRAASSEEHALATLFELAECCTLHLRGDFEGVV